VKLLGEPAHLAKPLVKLAQQLVEQVVRLVDQANQGVGGNLGRALLNIDPLGFIGPMRSTLPGSF
jgi:hypothetical protein